MIEPKNRTVVNYWMKYYTTDHCTLCGNRGVIDTTGVTTPAGLPVGRKNYCICPNGQSMRNTTQNIISRKAILRSPSTSARVGIIEIGEPYNLVFRKEDGVVIETIPCRREELFILPRSFSCIMTVPSEDVLQGEDYENDN